MDERILDKIKKLLALARSTSSEHEAANAMRKVQALMKEHQLTETDVALHEIAEQHTKRANTSSKQPQWASMLSKTIASAFGIDYLLSWQPAIGRCITFIGPKDRVEIGTYCYDVLAPQLVKARREFLAGLNKRLKTATKTNRADLFAEGWIIAVRSKVEALVPTEDEQQLIQLFMEKNYPDLRTSNSRAAATRVRDMNSKFMGMAKGQNVQLNAGVAGAAQGKLSHN